MLNGTGQQIARVRELIQEAHDNQVENAEEHGNTAEVVTARRAASIQANLDSMNLLGEVFTPKERV